MTKFRIVTEQPLGSGTAFDLLNALLCAVATVNQTTADSLWLYWKIKQYFIVYFINCVLFKVKEAD